MVAEPLASIRVAAPQKQQLSLISRTADFWLIGGASIVIWVILSLSQILRDSSFAIQSHFLQLGATFGLLSLVCNYPHFMLSYRFAYSRGWRFILNNSFSLLIVPLIFIVTYAWAFTHFHSEIGIPFTMDLINQTLARVGIDFKFGSSLNLGTELMRLSIWVMFLTVGWHYSKQVFGCMIVYSKFEGYPLTRFQRALLKSSVFSVAFLNFVYMSKINTQSGQFQPLLFFSVPLSDLGFADIYLTIAQVWLGISILSVLWFVVYRNYVLNKIWPTRNIAVPWIAFHIWWIPILRQQEFYFLIVPFFHSLQYLPFAFKMEQSKNRDVSPWRKMLFLMGLVFVGLMTFELIPEALDKVLRTEVNELPMFFTIAFVVFINVHHFFIDSVIWRSNQREIKYSLFSPPPSQIFARLRSQ